MFSHSGLSIIYSKCNFMYFLRLSRLYGISFTFTDMAISTGRQDNVQICSYSWNQTRVKEKMRWLRSKIHGYNTKKFYSMTVILCLQQLAIVKGNKLIETLEYSVV